MIPLRLSSAVVASVCCAPEDMLSGQARLRFGVIFEFRRSLCCHPAPLLRCDVVVIKTDVAC